MRACRYLGTRAVFSLLCFALLFLAREPSYSPWWFMCSCFYCGFSEKVSGNRMGMVVSDEVIVDKVYCYSIYDCKADAFSNILVFQNEALALRAFRNSVMSPDSVMFNNPEDFTLFMIGEFDMQDGKLSGCDKIAVQTGVQIKASV